MSEQDKHHHRHRHHKHRHGEGAARARGAPEETRQSDGNRKAKEKESDDAGESSIDAGAAEGRPAAQLNTASSTSPPAPPPRKRRKLAHVCPCGERIANDELWTSHRKECKKAKRCGCEKDFPTFAELKRHRKGCPTPYRCPKCGVTTFDKSERINWSRAYNRHLQDCCAEGAALTKEELEQVKDNMTDALKLACALNLDQPLPDSSRACKLCRNLPKQDELYEGKPHVYDSQKKEADEFLKRVMEKSATFPENCSALHVLILVPPRTSLHRQTLDRVHAFLRDLDLQVVIDVVMVGRSNVTAKTEGSVSQFYDKVKKHPEDFFLVIHDECHWGADADGVAGEILKKVLELSDKDNLLTIQISATAYNQVAILQESNKNLHNVLAGHVYQWNTFEDGPISYWGWRKLREKKHIVQDERVEEVRKEICRAVVTDYKLCNKLLTHIAEAETVATTMKYLAAVLRKYAPKFDKEQSELLDSKVPWLSKCVDDYTTQAVDFLDHGKLVAVRLPSSGLSSILSDLMDRLVCNLSKEQKFFCIHEATTDDKEATVSLACHCALVMRQGTPYPHLVTFQDLKGLPCLLTIVEKARMGDTFPPHFALLDLRARYENPFAYSAFLQDIGRACSWAPTNPDGEHPVVLLNRNAFQALDPLEAFKNGFLDSIDKFVFVTGRQNRGDKTIKEAVNGEPLELLEAFFQPSLLGHLPDQGPNESPGQGQPTRKSVWKYLENSINLPNLKHRFVFSAEPQIGKTGAYLHFIKLLAKTLHIHVCPARTDDGMPAEHDVPADDGAAGTDSSSDEGAPTNDGTLLTATCRWQSGSYQGIPQTAQGADQSE
eukprot:TRINITY_DN5040_c0_g1_i3.p1 TRINITY_DN5040_c0_g1~~TRINITY_DN5040_c0_g1_i3.p1  ORF type:complete len:832 (-),score=145.99 TRINITY_DN5040_c0_g1_i3:640-3135(-)